MTLQLQERLDRLSIPEPMSGCVLWLGAVSRDVHGYGTIVVRPSKNVRKCKGAHVVAYELKHGPVPSGLVVDHKCNNTLCVNADHLKAVTQRENVLRSDSIQAHNARKTHCEHGHPLSGDNLYVRADGTGRACKRCRADREIKRRAACRSTS